MPSRTKFVYILLLFILVLILAFNIIYAKLTLWDFRIYYYSVKTYFSNQNPYDLAILFRNSDGSVALNYVYPNITLLAFAPFTLFPYNIASYIYLIIKGVLLFLLLRLWQDKFLNVKNDLVFYLFCLFGYNAAIYVDFVSGNIATIEQTFLWFGFFLLIRRQLLWFCIIVVVVSTFKFTPMLFLVLLLFTSEKKKYLYFFSSILGFFVIQLLSLLLNQELYLSFLSNVLGIEEYDATNPTTLAFIKAVFKELEPFNVVIPKIVSQGIYLAIASVVIFYTWRAFRALDYLNEEDRLKTMIFLACVTSALILPRFKDYSFILLLVPTYYIIRKTTIKTQTPFLILCMLLPSQLFEIPPITLPGIDHLVVWVYTYYPIILAYGIWGLYLREINLERKKALTEQKLFETSDLQV